MSVTKKKILDLYDDLEKYTERYLSPYDEDTKTGSKILPIIMSKFRVEILIEFKDYLECIKIMHKMIDFCEEHREYKALMFVYCQLGIVYRLQRRYRLAIKFHIMQLEIAWDLKDMMNEMKAYENIAM